MKKITILFYAAFILFNGLPLARAQAHDHSAHMKGSLANEKPKPVLDNSIFNLPSSWTNQDGKKQDLESLRGHITVVAMTYTSCQAACPILIANMKDIEKQLPESLKSKVHFAVFSFDHKKDLPEKLKSYSQKQSLDLSRWTLFHGSKNSVQELALLLGIKYKRDSQGDYEHSNVITVLDSEGLIKYQQVGLNADSKETLETIKKLPL